MHVHVHVLVLVVNNVRLAKLFSITYDIMTIVL